MFFLNSTKVRFSALPFRFEQFLLKIQQATTLTQKDGKYRLELSIGELAIKNRVTKVFTLQTLYMTACPKEEIALDF